MSASHSHSFFGTLYLCSLQHDTCYTLLVESVCVYTCSSVMACTQVPDEYLTCMIVGLLIEHLADAVAQLCVSCNLCHDCTFEGTVVNVKLDNNEVSRLVYAPDYIQGMRGLPEVIRDWGVVKM